MIRILVISLILASTCIADTTLNFTTNGGIASQAYWKFEDCRQGDGIIRATLKSGNWP